MNRCFLSLVVFAGVVCSAVERNNKGSVSSQEMVDAINTMNIGWNATIYKEFIGMNWQDAKRMLGSKGAWPEDSPPKNVKMEKAKFIPENFDAREKWPKSIHPIRNQGRCGSCWAFGASESLSDRFAIVSHNQINVVLSAQQLVDCDRKNYGCTGGWPSIAWQYIETVGLLTEECYGTYIGKAVQCKVNGTEITRCPSGIGEERFYKAAEAYAVQDKVEAIQTEIMTNGPVEADFSVYADFVNYRSGVYTHTFGGYLGKHAIKMLGWGRSAEGVDYWICANSWGQVWGMEGYFLIRRGTNECGIESGITAGKPEL